MLINSIMYLLIVSNITHNVPINSNDMYLYLFIVTNTHISYYSLEKVQDRVI